MTSGIIIKHHENESAIEIEWEIENFSSLAKDIWNTSPSFAWSDANWKLSLKYVSSEKAIRLFLHKCSSEKNLNVVFKLGIRLADELTEKRCCLIRNFKSESSGFGTQEFITESELLERKRELLPGGLLSLSCKIAHLETLTQRKIPKAKFQSLEVLSSNFKALFDCTNYSDITITVGEQKYSVLKAILAARSDVFAAMFKHNMEEVNSGIINIVDCDPAIFKDFLLYLYSGKVENLSSNKVCYLYKIADKYNVEELKVYCIDYMGKNISTTNLFRFITLANQCNKMELVSKAQEFFNLNALEIMKGSDWEEFLKQNFPVANQLLTNMLKRNNKNQSSFKFRSRVKLFFQKLF